MYSRAHERLAHCGQLLRSQFLKFCCIHTNPATNRLLNSRMAEGSDPKKGDDPLGGTSRPTLSTVDRDAIVESILQHLTSLKEKSDLPHMEDLSKFHRHLDTATRARFMPRQ